MGIRGFEIAHSSPTLKPTEWIVIDSAIATGNAQWGIWSDTSNITPTEPVNRLEIANTCVSEEIANTCVSENVFGPTYLADLGVDVTLRNNKIGCGSE